MRRFFILGVDAVVADVRVREGDDLAGVGRIGQDFLVSRFQIPAIYLVSAMTLAMIMCFLVMLKQLVLKVMCCLGYPLLAIQVTFLKPLKLLKLKE